MSSFKIPPVPSQECEPREGAEGAGISRRIFHDFNLDDLDDESRESVAGLVERSRRAAGERDVLASLLQVGQWLGSREAARDFGKRTQKLPRAGEEVMGLRLVRELGRGAFARVFLAEQAALANRRVAVKISRAKRDESQTLAQLQHTHIVPIYSAHVDPATGLRAIVMPYFGGSTLDRLLDKACERGGRQATGRSLITALDDLSLNDGLVDGVASTNSIKVPRSNASQPSRLPSLGTSQEASPWLASRLFGRAFLGSWRDSAPYERTIGQPARNVLERSSYVQAVTWIAARLAEGLAHAHERGILHRDIKPSNVLVAFDGQPMLLDFNLARDLKSTDSGAVAYVGGTLPYMAPEHLDAFNIENPTPPSVVDARSDIFSLGVVIYEMLTNKHAFRMQRPGESLPKMLEEMAAERRRHAPSPRAVNPSVPQSLDAIVRRCLAADPSRRYPTAAQLAEDLERELDSLPLRHTREPSWTERARKWMRRHPKLTSGGSITAISIAALFGLVSLVLLVAGRLAGYDAERRWYMFQQGLVRAQMLVHTGQEPGQNLSEGQRVTEEALALFHVRDDDRWLERSRANRLSAAQRTALPSQAAEMMILLARVKADQSRLSTSFESRTLLLEEAIALLDRAERIQPSAAPRSLFEDRCEYRLRQGDTAGAQADWDRAEATPLRSARDHYMKATSLAAEKRFDEAIISLDAALRVEPKHFWSHFTLAICHDQLGRYAEAVRIYGTALALWPEFPWSYLNRGLAFSRLGNWTAAIDDYSTAIRLDSQFAEAYVNRGVARLKLHLYTDALSDLSTALDLGQRKAGVWAARAAAYAGLNDLEAARRDYAIAMQEGPGDISLRLSRGFTLARQSPEEALADFDYVLERQPRLAQGHYGRAVALSEIPGQTKAAIDAARRAIECDSTVVEARLALAVLLARAQRFEQAIAEAESVLAQGATGPTLYATACVYALASQDDPLHASRAFALLEQAIGQGYGRRQLHTDPDLNPLRNDPRFERLELPRAP